MNTRFDPDVTEPVPDTPLETCFWAAREVWRWLKAHVEEWTRPPGRILPFRPRRFGAAHRNRHLR